MPVTDASHYDLAIIGGGINGTGIARDAAGRGLKVLLLEKDDLASHTSSQSTKLVHGGLRYLEHYEFRLVAEIRTHTKLVGARRENGSWRITFADHSGASLEAKVRALVNASGPWVKELLDALARSRIEARVRHVKGSHIVVPRVHREEHA